MALMRLGACVVGLALVACHAGPAKSPQEDPIAAADAQFAVRAAAAERYAALAKQAPRMQILAHREASLAMIQANVANPCRDSDCSPRSWSQLSTVNQARLPGIQAIVNAGRPPIVTPPTVWTIDGDRSCGPLIAGLRAQVAAPDSSAATRATLTLAHCDFEIAGTPWGPATCQVQGQESSSGPGPGTLTPRRPTLVTRQVPCHQWTAKVGVTVVGAVEVAGQKRPFRHAWQDAWPNQSMAPPPLPAPVLPTVDQLVGLSLVSGHGPVLDDAAHLIAISIAPDHDQLLLQCIDLPPHEYRPQPLELGLYDAAAARCKTVMR